MSMLRWPRVERELTSLNGTYRRFEAEQICLAKTIRGRSISYAGVQVESRSKDGNFHRVETAYAAGMGLV